MFSLFLSFMSLSPSLTLSFYRIPILIFVLHHEHLLLNFFPITQLIKCIQEASRGKKPTHRHRGYYSWQEVGHYLKDELTLCGNKEVNANGWDQIWLNSSCKGCEAVTTTLSLSLSAEWGFTTSTVETITSCLAYLNCEWKSESQNLLHQLSHWFY